MANTDLQNLIRSLLHEPCSVEHAADNSVKLTRGAPGI